MAKREASNSGYREGVLVNHDYLNGTLRPLRSRKTRLLCKTCDKVCSIGSINSSKVLGQYTEYQVTLECLHTRTVRLFEGSAPRVEARTPQKLKPVPCERFTPDVEECVVEAAAFAAD
jgi:hypothetical protein